MVVKQKKFSMYNLSFLLFCLIILLLRYYVTMMMMLMMIASKIAPGRNIKIITGKQIIAWYKIFYSTSKTGSK